MLIVILPLERIRIRKPMAFVAEDHLRILDTRGECDGFPASAKSVQKSTQFAVKHIPRVRRIKNRRAEIGQWISRRADCRAEALRELPWVAPRFPDPRVRHDEEVRPVVLDASDAHNAMDYSATRSESLSRNRFSPPAPCQLSSPYHQ